MVCGWTKTRRDHLSTRSSIRWSRSITMSTRSTAIVTRSPMRGLFRSALGSEGPPMRTGRYERERDLCDGAGICSVGRWPPWRRPASRDSRVLSLGAALRRAVLRAVDQTDGGLSVLFGKSATGQLRESPFPDSLKKEFADYAVSLFHDDGEGGAAPREEDLPQPVRVRLIQALQRAIGDPDPPQLWDSGHGHALGWTC